MRGGDEEARGVIEEAMRATPQAFQKQLASENKRNRSSSAFLTHSKRGREKNARNFLKQKATAFPRKVTRCDVIQHGRPDAMTIQNGRPDGSQDGGQDVTSFKMADWL